MVVGRYRVTGAIARVPLEYVSAGQRTFPELTPVRVRSYCLHHESPAQGYFLKLRRERRNRSRNIKGCGKHPRLEEPRRKRLPGAVAPGRPPAIADLRNLPAAERFKTLLEDHGPDEALRIIELDEIGRHVPTVTAWLSTHIDNLTGVQPATLARYRTYVARDVDPVFGSMPITAVTETTIARWVKQLAAVARPFRTSTASSRAHSTPRCALG